MARPIAVAREWTPSLRYRFRRCERTVFADRQRRSPISRVESSEAKSRITASSAGLGSSRTTPVLARVVASSISRSTSSTRAGRGCRRPGSRRAPRARSEEPPRSIEASATGAHPGEQQQQPCVMHGRHVVAEGVLGRDELALRLRELPFRLEQGAHRRRDVRAEPAPTRGEPSDELPCLLGMIASQSRRSSATAASASVVCTCINVGTRRVTSGCSSAHSAAGPRLLEIAGEVERTSVRGERAVGELGMVGLRHFDGTATVGHRRADSAFDRKRAADQGGGTRRRRSAPLPVGVRARSRAPDTAAAPSRPRP